MKGESGQESQNINKKYEYEGLALIMNPEKSPIFEEMPEFFEYFEG